MALVETAVDLIKLVSPHDLESIRAIFSGTKVSLDIFTRTVQTFIPRSYTSSETAIAASSRAIVDLFEELDTDMDGFVTWYDFIGYYSEVSSDMSTIPGTLPPEPSGVFHALLATSTSTSGKAAFVSIDTAVKGGAEVADLQGTYIMNIYMIGDTFYVVTDLGVYTCSQTFQFPKLIFEPRAEVLSGSVEDRRRLRLDAKTKDRIEDKAYEQLASMGVDVTDVRDKRMWQAQKQISEEPAESPLLGAAPRGTSSASPIVCTLLLDPLPLLVICTKEPLFIVMALTGNMGLSDPFRIAATASALFWDSTLSYLYIGHVTGAVSVFKINTKRGTGSEILDQLERDAARLEQQAFDARNPVEVARRILAGAPGTPARGVDSLTRDELVRIFPELKAQLMDLAQFTAAADGGAAESAERTTLRSMMDAYKRMSPETLELQPLEVRQIFDAHCSAIDAHNIKRTSLILEDPQAFVEAALAPDPVLAAIRKRKHGGVFLQIMADFVASKYCVNGGVRCIAGGRGHWEDPVRGENFRIVVAGSDAAVLVLDELLDVVCTFADLHPEGVTAVHVVGDSVTTVGFDNVYQIDAAAVQMCYSGNVVEKEANLYTTDSPYLAGGRSAPLLGHSGISTTARGRPKITRPPERITINDAKLLSGDLIKSQHMIRLIAPPRPGAPILSSFRFGDIIGVLDHSAVVSIFHAVSGTHITRVRLSIPSLLGAKLGLGGYSPFFDQGYIPIGKHVYCMKAVANEDTQGTEGIVWDFQRARVDEERRARGEHVSQAIIKFLPVCMPLGSVSKDVSNIAVNRRMGEVAVIASDSEIIVYSLASGRPVRLYDMERIASSMTRGDAADTDSETSRPRESGYGIIESNDLGNAYTEGQSEIDKDNVITETGRRGFRNTGALKKVPTVLNPLKKTAPPQEISIFDALGSKVLALAVDGKGRILFVIGAKGIVTLYWKTGSLFDITNVGIVGNQVITPGMQALAKGLPETRVSVDNAFGVPSASGEQTLQTTATMITGLSSARHSRLAGNLPGGGDSGHIPGGMSTYSLGVDLSSILARPHNIEIIRRIMHDHSIMRSQIAEIDTNKGVLFLYDTLNPQMVRVINVYPSQEFNDMHSNRMLTVLDIYPGRNNDLLLPCRNELCNHFKQKSIFIGRDDCSIPYAIIRRFCPDFLCTRQDTPPSGEEPSAIKLLLDTMINTDMHAKESTLCYVTCMAVSKELSLLAVGTSDGRVLVYDTISTKFLHQGTIYHPKIDTEDMSITTVSFFGDKPLMFSANTNGYCMVHTVRPCKPQFALACAFRHGNYSPVSYPLSVNFTEHWNKTANAVKKITKHYTEFTSERIIQNSRENDVIRWLLTHFLPDIQGTKYLPEQEYVFGSEAHDAVIANAMVRLGYMKGGDQASLGRQSLPRKGEKASVPLGQALGTTASLRLNTLTVSGLGDNDATSTLAESAVTESVHEEAASATLRSTTTLGGPVLRGNLENSDVLASRYLMISVSQKGKHGTSGGSDTMTSTGAQCTDNLGDRTISATTEGDDGATPDAQPSAAMTEMYDCYIISAVRIFQGRTMLRDAEGKTLVSKRRRLILKLRAVVQAIGLVYFYFRRFMKTKVPMFVDLEALPVDQKPKAKPMRRRVTLEYGAQEIKLSEKSQRVLSEFAKTQNNNEEKSDSDYAQTDKQLELLRAQHAATNPRLTSAASMVVSASARKQELDSELLDEYDGIMYKYAVQDRKLVKLPLRKESITILRNVTQPTCSVFDPRSNTLLVGDETGYLVAYDVARLLLSLNVDAAAARARGTDLRLSSSEAVLDSALENTCTNIGTTLRFEKESQVGFMGYMEQALPPDLFTAEDSGKLSPLLSSSDTVLIRYAFRAHPSAMRQVFMADSTGTGVITMGIDRRILCWSTKDGTLLGNIVRVNLDKPPETWERLLQEPLVQHAPESLQLVASHRYARRPTKKTHQLNLSLALNDLRTTRADTDSTINPMLPPPVRIEAPPSCMYPWKYCPTTYENDETSRLLVTGVSTSEYAMRTLGKVSEGSSSYEVARRILSSRMPVNILAAQTGTDGARDTASPHSALLKTTGVTQRMLDRNGSSWTVRAMIARANASLSGSPSTPLSQTLVTANDSTPKAFKTTKDVLDFLEHKAKSTVGK